MTIKRILFASEAANLGGLQSSTHARIAALKSLGIISEKLFLKSGAGKKTYSDVTVHITNKRKKMVEILQTGKYDAVSMINRIDLLPVLRDIGFQGRVLFEVRGRSKNAIQVLPKLMANQVGGIIVISHYVKRLVHRYLRSQHIPVHVVYNAVDTELFRPLKQINRQVIPCADDARKRPIVLWVGRLSENKNYVEMLEIAKLLQQEPPQPTIWVVADTKAKDNRKKFWREVRRCGLQEHVRLLQCIPHRSMVHIYNLVGESGGCVLSTSKSEGFQNSLLEGMACGVPVVSTAVGGNVELIQDNVNGRLYPVGKTMQATRLLLELLREPKRRQAYVKAGWQRVQLHHTPAQHANNFVTALESTRILTFEMRPVP